MARDWDMIDGKGLGYIPIGIGSAVDLGWHDDYIPTEIWPVPVGPKPSR